MLLRLNGQRCVLVFLPFMYAAITVSKAAAVKFNPGPAGATSESGRFHVLFRPRETRTFLWLVGTFSF